MVLNQLHKVCTKMEITRARDIVSGLEIDCSDVLVISGLLRQTQTIRHHADHGLLADDGRCDSTRVRRHPMFLDTRCLNVSGVAVATMAVH